jgi:hypothetical protein
MEQPDLRAQIRSLLWEVETYLSHGLFVESRRKAIELYRIIKATDRIPNRDRHLESLKRRIRDIEKQARAFEEIAMSARMSPVEQERVKRLFAFSLEKNVDARTY